MSKSESIPLPYGPYFCPICGTRYFALEPGQETCGAVACGKALWERQEWIKIGEA